MKTNDDGQTCCFVTGAARNIGLAVAKKFAKEGYNVCLTSRSEKSADSAAREIMSEYPGITAKGYAMLTNDVNQIRETFKKVKADFGRVDALVSNAADPGYNQSILSTTPEQFDYVMNSNAKGYFSAVRRRHGL